MARKLTKAEKADQRRIAAGTPKLTPEQIKLLRAYQTLQDRDFADMERLHECGLIQYHHEDSPTLTETGRNLVDKV
jgi:hypothetical protein